MSKINIENLELSIIKKLNTKIEDLTKLKTEDKSSIVGAINEVLGKHKIVDAIGEPLKESDTWNGMSDKINELLDEFKRVLVSKDIQVETEDKLKKLISRVDTFQGSLVSSNIIKNNTKVPFIKIPIIIDGYTKTGNCKVTGNENYMVIFQPNTGEIVLYSFETNELTVHAGYPFDISQTYNVSTDCSIDEYKGKLYIANGTTNQGCVFDIETKTFSTKTFGFDKIGCSWLNPSNGMIYFNKGEVLSGKGEFNVYDISTNTTTTLEGTNHGFPSKFLIVGNDSLIYKYGGQYTFTAGKTTYNQLNIYDIKANTWTYNSSIGDGTVVNGVGYITKDGKFHCINNKHQIYNPEDQTMVSFDGVGFGGDSYKDVIGKTNGKLIFGKDGATSSTGKKFFVIECTE